MIGLPLKPLSQAYDVPAKLDATVNTVVSPLQIGLAEVVIEIIGLGLTVRIIFAVSKHPNEFPTTVKVVVVAGDTLIGFVVPSPPFQA